MPLSAIRLRLLSLNYLPPVILKLAREWTWAAFMTVLSTLFYVLARR